METGIDMLEMFPADEDEGLLPCTITCGGRTCALTCTVTG